MQTVFRFMLSIFLPVAVVLVVVSQAHAQRARIDLDDMMIKGELHNDDRLMILSRQKDELKNYVKFRTQFRKEMLQELPQPTKKLEF